MPERSAAYASVDRRRALLLAGGGLCGLTIPRAVGALEPAGSLRLAIHRGGDEIGRYTIDFARKGKSLEVRTQVAIEVSITVVPVFRYEQKAHDLWRDGVLVESHVTTNDNGEITELDAFAEDGQLIVRGAETTRRLPLGIMTDLCFWNRAIVEQSDILDVKSGELHGLAASPVGTETIAVGGDELACARYAMRTETRNGEIWYDKAGRWVQAVVTTRGEKLLYKLEA